LACIFYSYFGKRTKMEGLGRTRREFLKDSIYFGVAAGVVGSAGELLAMRRVPGSGMRFGLVTYLWGQDWDLPTLIANCTKTNVLGVELRTEHAHKVESNLSAQQRSEVKKRFADSKVELVGLGTNFAFHDADPAKLKANIDRAKEYLWAVWASRSSPTTCPRASRRKRQSSK
jgi:hypothetical protein